MSQVQIPTTVKDKNLVEKRREQIVLAAIKLFARSGFHRTTLRELAEEAGISQGNIYDYVGSKQDIFFLIHEFMNNLATAKMERALGGVRDPLEKLRRMIEAEFDLMYDWSDAILLLYQETHVLNKPLLKALLKRERGRVSVLEGILKECMESGHLRDCNIRVATNIIKGMTETWVTKRWDLKGHADGKQMENAIIDMVFDGLVEGKSSSRKGRLGKGLSELAGRSILILNGGTNLGMAIAAQLASDGARVYVHKEDDGAVREVDCSGNKTSNSKRYKCYSSRDYGEKGVKLVDKILDDMGSADILIHDFGGSPMKGGPKKWVRETEHIYEGLNFASLLRNWVKERLVQLGLKHILYLVPPAWGHFEDPIDYEIRKAGIIALTKEMAKELARESVTVNCLVPGFIAGTTALETERKLASNAKSHIPFGRMGEISDVIEAVRFFLSSKSKYVTGQVLSVSGGL